MGKVISKSFLPALVGLPLSAWFCKLFSAGLIEQLIIRWLWLWMIHHTVKIDALGLFLKGWEEEREWCHEICEWGSLSSLAISLYSLRKTLWLLPGSAWPKKCHSASLREKGNMSPCLHRHTSSLVLTCISKPLTRCSWKRTRDTHGHIHSERRRGEDWVRIRFSSRY